MGSLINSLADSASEQVAVDAAACFETAPCARPRHCGQAVPTHGGILRDTGGFRQYACSDSSRPAAVILSESDSMSPDQPQAVCACLRALPSTSAPEAKLPRAAW